MVESTPTSSSPRITASGSSGADVDCADVVEDTEVVSTVDEVVGVETDFSPKGMMLISRATTPITTAAPKPPMLAMAALLRPLHVRPSGAAGGLGGDV